MSNYAKLVETVQEKGAAAYRAGQGVDTCPYNIETKQGRKFKRLWLAGYVNEREKALKPASSFAYTTLNAGWRVNDD